VISDKAIFLIYNNNDPQSKISKIDYLQFR